MEGWMEGEEKEIERTESRRLPDQEVTAALGVLTSIEASRFQHPPLRQNTYYTKII